MRRIGVVLAGVVTALVISSGAAWAVSDGQYSPDRQHCTGTADDNESPQRVEPGCLSLILGANDGVGPELFFFGFQQTKEDESVDPSAPVVGGSPEGLDPIRQLRLYMGADDNLSTGEHDSSPVISNGPSDGGAIVVNYRLQSMGKWSRAVIEGNLQYLLLHPVPLIDAGLGACADGVCFAATTIERVAYEGGGDRSHRQPVADYSGKEWDPPECAGPSDEAADCGPGGIATWHSKDGTRTTEPGLQVFEDPDPQASPLGPYPLPALYAGSCGVIFGGGDLAGPTDTPVTNSAGQLDIETGC